MKKFLVRIGTGLLAITICLVPTWIYLLARLLLSPNGFWQEFVVFGLGVYLLGFAQFLLALILIWFLWHLWIKKEWMGFWGI
jgi:uncharacterized membrane protein